MMCQLDWITMTGDAGLKRLEDLAANVDVFRNFKTRQQFLERAVAADSNFLNVYERLILEVVLPYLAKGLRSHHETQLSFHYQYPPTLRVQPGPSPQFGRVHRDAEYGHQDGEINFWMPLSDYNLTQTTLFVETSFGSDDFHPLDINYGQIARFHGTQARHYAPPNRSAFTRVSLDFRIGVSRFFDPTWRLDVVKLQHGRKFFQLPPD